MFYSVKRIVFILSIALVLSGCVSSVTTLKAKTIDNQELIYSNGMDVTVSKKKSKVILGTKPNFFRNDGRIELLVALKNGSRDPINFSTSNLSVKSNSGKLLKVFTYEELIAEANQKQQMQSLATALYAYNNAMNIERSSYSTYYGSSTYSHHGTISNGRSHSTYSGTSRGTHSGVIYNPAQGAYLNMINRQQAGESFSRIQNNYTSYITSLNQNYLMPNTVCAASTYEASILVESPIDKEEIEVTIDLQNGEKHKFFYNTSIVTY